MGNKLTLLIMFIVFIAGCTKDSNRNKDHVLAHPEKQPAYLMAGKVEARNKVDVTSSFSANILQLTKRVGDHVNKGETLIVLDRKEIQAQLQGLQKTYDTAKTNLDRANALMAKGYISGQQQEMLETQVKQSLAALEVAKAQIEKGTIDSPIDGVISAVNVNEGETPASNTVLMSIVNSTHVYVKAFIPENLLYKIAVGMKVDLRISEISEHPYHGNITVIDAVVDPKSKTTQVNIEATDFDTNVKPGMMVLVGTESNRSENQ
jgi:HlyD family secretion protein